MLTQQKTTPQKTADVTSNAQFFEYTEAADPIGKKLIPTIPYHSFKASLYNTGPTRIVPLDLSTELASNGPATGPGMLANFIRIVANEAVTLDPIASSQVVYVLEGKGSVQQGNTGFEFATGDFFTLPGGAETVLNATATSRLYYVNDAPLLDYLGVQVARPRFSPTLYPARRARAELDKAINAPGSGERNRMSILLGNANFPQTRTITHSMWVMYGIVPAGANQKPHRHQSIALDFISECAPGCYTLVGTELDDSGSIVDPVRVDWEPGMVFVTPPGYWHSHHNESGEDCFVIPFQDAGLHTYLRTLNIQFSS